MQIIVKCPGRATWAFTVPGDATTSDLIDRIQHTQGIRAQHATLLFGDRLLPSLGSLQEFGVNDGSCLQVVGRLRGGAGSITVTVQPRVQTERWSTYWKESMATKTTSLEPFSLTIDADATVEQLLEAVQKQLKWEPVGSLLALEGFKEPWEHAVVRGRAIPAGGTLGAAGLEDGGVVTTVRKQLVAEGWKIRAEGDEDDSSSDEEDEDDEF